MYLLTYIWVCFWFEYCGKEQEMIQKIACGLFCQWGSYSEAQGRHECRPFNTGR